MANQEFPLPIPGDDKRKSSNLLPKFFRTTSNVNFLQATLDQLIQPGVAEKISGYYGRKVSKAYNSQDNYIGDVSGDRENYQVEPAVVFKDEFDNVKFYKDYNDYINQTKIFGGNVKNHDKLNSQEYYPWNPNIDWDKFVNFREYYWLPNGPQSIAVRGQAQSVQSTYTVTLEEDDDNFAYVFSPNGFTRNPNLKLYRGQTYRFEIDTPGHPIAFAISRSFTPGTSVITAGREGVRGTGLYDSVLYGNEYDIGEYIVLPDSGSVTFEEGDNVSTIYPDGIRKLGESGEEVATVYIEKGTIEFTVPLNAPDRLFYISKNDVNTSGVFRLYDIEENTAIDVEAEILGKKNYLSANNVNFTNGLKVYFQGNVTPEKYANNEWYVEGVGDKIKLVRDRDLLIPSQYSQEILLPFDSEGFDRLPYSDASAWARDKDYLVVNRASRDRNAWSRYNRWFHRSVIEQSAEYNNQPLDLDETSRARRPIIEFEAGLKLYNFGTEAKLDVDLVDDFTTDVFSIIEGSLGYNIDGVSLTQDMRVLFTADTDILVKGKIYKVNFLKVGNDRQISLIETDDTLPLENETVLVTQGDNYGGKTLHYTNGSWKLSQVKEKLNQPPLFDLCCPQGNEYADPTIFESTTFKGTKIFSYRVGEGADDVELGFPLTYRNIENSGDILFDFNLLTDYFTVQQDDGVYTVKTDTSYLRKYNDRETFEYANGWSATPVISKQKVILQYDASPDLPNNFQINCFDRAGDLNDLVVNVFLNNYIQIPEVDYTVDRANGKAYVRFFTEKTTGDVIKIKAYSKTEKNENGYYEFPINLEKNPLNEDITEFTLGEVIDHVDSMIEDVNNFEGTYPGIGNLRDLGDLDKFGKRFVKHTGPLNLSVYNFTSKKGNLLESIRFAKTEYQKFKRGFVQTATDFKFDGTIKDHCNAILAEMNKNKKSTGPFYFTDMIPVGASKTLEYQVVDPNNPFYALSAIFNNGELSNSSVQVYLNGKLLVYGADYTFNESGYALVITGQQKGDTIEIIEWENTDGSFIPSTPTKLGLFPKYVPEIIIDDTYTQPTKMIRGHDGSLIKAFDDYRDDLILELERRIFNNIKLEYNTDKFDLYDYLGGYYRDTGISKQDIDNVVLADFVQWQELVNFDLSDHSDYLRTDQFTFNYSNMSGYNNEVLPGNWRGIYIQLYDTDSPHLRPWEMLGFTIKPLWWDDVYGVAPYTSNNFVLWEDIQEGVIREPGQKIRRNSKFARPGIMNHLPVDSAGKLLAPLEANFAKNYVQRYTSQNWKFGDHSPVETAWRRSSDYPFALLIALIVNKPADIIGKTFDLSRIEKNFVNQFVYKDTGKHIKLDKLIFPNLFNNDERTFTSGLVNYVYNYLTYDITTQYENYIEELTGLKSQLGFKLGGYTSKPNFNLILDARSPGASEKGGIFIPQENYQIFLNTSSPIDSVNYSGVTIEKTAAGYVIRGYDFTDPKFKYFKHYEAANDPVITVGGVSETFSDWAANKRYIDGEIVRFQNDFFRVTETHTSTNSFDFNVVAKLPELPIVGGRRAILRKNFNKNRIYELTYGTLLKTSQEVVDFMLGYSAYLENIGFVFDSYNVEIEDVENWTLTTKEFLFWTTQNWAQGSVISLSPAARILEFKREYATVDNLYDGSYKTQILNSDARAIDASYNHTLRELNAFGLTLKNTNDGIYSITLPLVQKEHVVLIDNVTEFNDIIYQPSTGYRQERVKVLGYRTADWNGTLNIPGFFFDEATVTRWESYKDYQIGDLVKHKEFYYVAIEKVPGSQVFDSSYWQLLADKPESTLFTNFEYKINQFSDFYDLDSDNFDSEQQRLAQHLIGYQKRDYLSNIIQDDVSEYKFYQGYITEKGTTNALTKLFDKLSDNETDSLEFYEEWALRTGMYGDSENVDEAEFILDETKFLVEPQPIELVETLPSTDVVDFVYRQRPFEVYNYSKDYNHKPFPTKTQPTEYVKHVGYVREEDINFRVKTFDEITGLDATQIELGEYIWVGEKETDWDVVQHVNSELILRAWSVEDSEFDQIDRSVAVLQFFFDTFVEDQIQAGDLISVNQATEYGMVCFFRVFDVNRNRVMVDVPADVRINPAQGAVVDLDLRIGIIRSVRVADKQELNALVTDLKFPGQKVWVNEYDNGTWAVLENTKLYNPLVSTTNPSEYDSTKHDYGTTITATLNNRNMMVGSPGEFDGRVHVYRRTLETGNWILDQTLTPPEDVATSESDFLEFGKSVAVTPDGNYLAVGMPNISNPKTRDKGQFDIFGNYQKNDVVRYKESLWRVNREILPQSGGQPFESFNSYTQLLAGQEDDSSLFTLLITGNPYLDNQQTDHFLVRAPKNAYLGTEKDNWQIGLTWNKFSAAHPTDDEYQPWEGDSGLTDVDITNTFTITEKVDEIIYLPSYTILPAVGSNVTSTTGSGEVVYVHNVENEAVVYLKDVNGTFELTGLLFLNDDDVIGEYTIERTANFIDNLSGYWMFTLPGGATYDNGTTWFDTGRGLVYNDMKAVSDPRQINEYVNIINNVKAIGPYTGQQNQASQIINLTYEGDPYDVSGTYNSQDVIGVPGLWAVRVNKTFYDRNDPGDLTVMDLYSLENNPVPVEDIAMSFDQINIEHEIYDKWDGYIDFEYTEFDFLGNIFEVQVGDIIEDEQIPFDAFGGLALSAYAPTSKAEVVYYQRDFLQARIYLRNIEGDWSTLPNVARYKLKRLARFPGDPERTVGTVESENLGIAMGTDQIGGLLIFQIDQTGGPNNLPLPSQSTLIDKEYSFYNVVTNTGITRLANYPYSTNKDYSQIYSIPIDEFGTNGEQHEGIVAFYRRLRNGQYRYMNSIVSENRFDNKLFGTKIKWTQQDTDYTLYVTSKGNSTPGNDGTLEIIKHGVIVDDLPDYRGLYNENTSYENNEIVLYDGKYYRAKIPVPYDEINPIRPTNRVYWEDRSFRYGKDENYRGLYDNSYEYREGELVSYPINDSALATPQLYQALTNVAEGTPFQPAAWQAINNGLDYLGYLPNNSGSTFYNEGYFSPELDVTQFASDFDTSKSGDVLVVTTNQTAEDSSGTYILVYRKNEQKYYLDQVIRSSNTNTGFGFSVAISEDGKTIAISEPFDDTIKTDQGKVLIYKQQTINGITQFNQTQTLYSPNNEETEKFGYKVKFGNNNLVITSINGDIELPTTFDSEGTTFDNGFTRFNNTLMDRGLVYVYEQLIDTFVLSEDIKIDDPNIFFFGENLLVNQNHIYIGQPRFTENNYQGKIYDFRKPYNTKSWNVISEPIKPVDIDKIESVFLYNKKTQEIVTYLDYVDMIQGKIPGPAEQELTYKTPYDPANYNVTALTEFFSSTTPWGPDQVGQLWWNVSEAKFLYPYQGDINFQKNYFNLLMPNTAIQICEWVESDYTPDDWDDLSGTEDGIRAGISGNTLYGNSAYVQKINYDPASKTFGSKFYYWVVNKTTIPQFIEGRNNSANDLALLMTSPGDNGYRHVTFLSENRFVVHNCNSLLNDDNIVLSVRWRKQGNAAQNSHKQYQIMSESLATSELDNDLERKWFDSLIGYDENIKVVPDPSLPVKQKYGSLFKPRQSMFVNQTEALKQYIERVNSVLDKTLVIDEYDISPLFQSQELPSSYENLYDTVIDIEEELRFIGTSKITPAEISLTVTNGKITRATIENAGRGYKVPPTYTIIGTGKDAELSITINNLGQVTNVEVINQGYGYEDTATVLVRKFAVLTKSDSTVYGKWSIYEWNNETKDWFRKIVQEFDVSLFWNYKDWYAEGYSKYIKPTYTIEGSYLLPSLNDKLGNIIKINNIGSGGWLLLEKIAENNNDDDYTINYKTVGRQNGTINFSDALYDLLGNSIGYDNRSYDSYFYDAQPIKETREILKTVKNNLFVKTLKAEYNKLWFASLRYVFAEQQYVDWAFKTSFVKAIHNVGSLDQDVTFDADNLASYEDYVKEVKPFATTIREYVSSYKGLDNTRSLLTDFDNAPAYDVFEGKIKPSKTKIQNNDLIGEREIEDEYPRRFWLENVGYSVASIKIDDPGSGYTYKPKVTIEGGGGVGAVAEAYLGAGKIKEIKIIEPGEGYVSTPTITIEGSQTDTGTPATASVILGNGLVRSTSVKVKFDRVSGQTYITDLNASERFYGTGAKTIYNLEWPMELDRSKVSVYVNGTELLRSEYSFENIEDTLATSVAPKEFNYGNGVASANDGVQKITQDYTKIKGRLIFTTPPANESTIDVQYYKPLSLLNAQDRIRYAYNPTVGMLGKELNQLMDGIDYGGVEIRSYDFGGPSGWNSLGWNDTIWDEFDNTFEDEIFTFDGSTISVQLSTPLENGINYNVYRNGVRLDDPNYGTPQQTNTDAIISTIVGDGTTDIIYLDELSIFVGDGDTLIIRKETSDGSFLPDPDSYDTLLTGGDLAYQTATGVNAEDIVVDGDGFVTPTTSKGPEELVPGQLVDTLDIQVYTRDSKGQGQIFSQVHISDGIKTEYDLGSLPTTIESIFVKVDNEILAQDDYTIHWKINTIEFNTAPALNSKINLVVVPRGQQNILDTGTFIGDGSSNEFITNVDYQSPIDVHLTINGVRETAFGLDRVNDSSLGDNKTLIRFDTAPIENSLISYAIFYADEEINYSQVSKDVYVGNGSETEFVLNQPPLYQEPTTYSTIVKVDDKILNAGYNLQFTIPETLDRQYQLELFQQPAGSLPAEAINVYLNGVELTFAVQWRWDVFNSAVELLAGIGVAGDVLEIFVTTDGEYNIIGPKKTYINVPYINVGTVSGTGLQFNISRSNGEYTASIIDRGLEYEIGDTFRVLGSAVDGENGTNNITLEVTSLLSGIVEFTANNIGVDPVRQAGRGIYRDVPATGGNGTGATFDCIVNQNGSVTVNQANPGKDYLEGDILIIDDALIGGEGDSSVGDITITVDTINQNSVAALEVTGVSFNGAKVRFATAPDAASNIEIFTFTNHDLLEIERQSYDVVQRSTLTAGTEPYVTYGRLTKGEITLRKPAIAVPYVWVVQNGRLLTPSSDYYLTDGLDKIRLKDVPNEDDVIEVIHFAADANTPKFAYRQFKDMLNRYHFKRIDAAETELAQPLNEFDLRIEVKDASKLPDPNKGKNLPGIIWIDGERIEYLIKTDNTLRQLRRGTLGTGVKTTYPAGTDVYNQGVEKNIPYKDQTYTQVHIADGTTNTVPLNFTPESINDFEVFVAGRRLRKTSISIFNPSLALNSPEGDETFEAEYTFEGNTLTLLDTPLEDTRITIVRRVGQQWVVDAGIPLALADNDIAKFLRAGTGKLIE